MNPAVRSRSKATATFVVSLALAVGVTACGSSHKSSTSTSSAAAAGSSTSSGSTSASPTTATTTTTVAGTADHGPALVVGDQAGTGAEALLTAAGLLHKLPFAVKFADFTSGPPILDAMNAGSVEIGGVGDSPPVFAAAGGDNLAIVGARQNNVAAAALVVPKGSSITSIQQLKGKKIAVAQGSSGAYHLLTVLTKAGLSTHDVQLVYLQPAEAYAALSSGAVAAWDVWSPFIEEATIEKGARILVNGNGYGANYAYEVASKSAIDNPTKAKEIREYLTVLDQAYVWATKHPDAWARTWATSTGLPTDVMDKAASDDTTIPIPVSSATESSEQGLVTAFYKAGLIPKSYSFAPYSTTAFNASVH